MTRKSELPSRVVDTKICLPPGVLSRTVVREILRLVFEEFQWFPAVRYGVCEPEDMDLVLPGEVGMDGILACYERHGSVFVDNDSGREFIYLYAGSQADYPYVGKLIWTTREASVEKGAWRETHARTVARLMKVLNSPLAYAGLEDDIDAKCQRWIFHEVGSTQEFTINNYSEGLAGLFWRNFFGPPFVRMFGESLRSLPPEVHQDFGDEILLVEPYPLPKDADTEVGKSRERALIELLGPECFYDHQRLELPTRRPAPADLPAPIGVLRPPAPKAGEV